MLFTTTTFLVFFLWDIAYGADKTVDLSWTVPTLNSDGSPLTDLMGYRLYSGPTADGPWGNPIDIGIPTTAYTWTAPEGTDGVIYFTLTAYDDAGNESERSNVVSDDVDNVAPGIPPGLKVFRLAPGEGVVIVLPGGG